MGLDEAPGIQDRGVFDVMSTWLAMTLVACVPAREARWSGDLRGAEQAARACLEQSPEDADALMELSRSLGLQGRLEEAQREADKARSQAPNPSSVSAWQARLYGWEGRMASARQALRLACADDCPSERWSLWQRSAPLRLESTSAIWAREEREALIDTELAAEARLGQAVWLRPRTAARWRSPSATPDDLVVGLGLRTTHRRLSFRVALSRGLRARSLPEWDGSAGVEYRLHRAYSVELSLRALSFREGASGILRPGLCAEWGRTGLCVRPSAIWLSNRVRAFALLQGWYILGPRYDLRFGAGGGNTTDFLLLRAPQTGRSGVAYVGLGTSPWRLLRFGLDYALRVEATETTAIIHRLGVGLTFHLGPKKPLGGPN